LGGKMAADSGNPVVVVQPPAGNHETEE